MKTLALLLALALAPAASAAVSAFGSTKESLAELWGPPEPGKGDDEGLAVFTERGLRLAVDFIDGRAEKFSVTRVKGKLTPAEAGDLLTRLAGKGWPEVTEGTAILTREDGKASAVFAVGEGRITITTKAWDADAPQRARRAAQRLDELFYEYEKAPKAPALPEKTAAECNPPPPAPAPAASAPRPLPAARTKSGHGVAVQPPAPPQPVIIAPPAIVPDAAKPAVKIQPPQPEKVPFLALDARTCSRGLRREYLVKLPWGSYSRDEKRFVSIDFEVRNNTSKPQDLQVLWVVLGRDVTGGKSFPLYGELVPVTLTPRMDTRFNTGEVTAHSHKERWIYLRTSSREGEKLVGWGGVLMWQGQYVEFVFNNAEAARVAGNKEFWQNVKANLKKIEAVGVRKIGRKYADKKA
ncbi:MAG: hypothetical protein ACR2OZ_10760 [Verrucomicrobiales bacterium]